MKDNHVTYSLFSTRSNKCLISSSEINDIFEKIATYKRPNLLVRVKDTVNDVSYNLADIKTNYMIIAEKYTMKYLNMTALDFYNGFYPNFSCIVGEQDSFKQRTIYYEHKTLAQLFRESPIF